MIRPLVLTFALLFCALTALHAQQGPDDKYVFIYSQILEADNAKERGDTTGAASKYAEAQKALKDLQATYPDWNKKIVDYRLDYLSGKLAEIAPPAPAGAPAVPPPAMVEAPKEGTPKPAEPGPIPGAAKLNVGLTQPPSLKEMQDEMARLNKENDLLKAKLKEALSVQPPAMDPRELSKTEEKLKAIEKDRDLLKASLEQEQAKSAKMLDPELLEKEKQLVAEAKKKMEEQAAQLMVLQKENLELRKQLGESLPPETKVRLEQQGQQMFKIQKENEMLKEQLAAVKANVPPVPGKGSMAEELSISRVLIAALTETNIALRTERILLENKVAELSSKVVPRSAVKDLEEERDQLRKRLNVLTKELNRHKSPVDFMPAQLQRQLEIARARLEVYESNPVPYTPEELAFFKKAETTATQVETNALKKAPFELPAGAGPIFQEARVDLENSKYEDAERKFAQILRQDEKNATLLTYLGMTQIQLNKLTEADLNLKKALEIDPQDPGVLYTLGYLKYKQNK
ncbi:MAG TPA: tetratricopeptide repeat protein, partial [Verrucomicrobiae bacterium]